MLSDSVPPLIVTSVTLAYQMAEKPRTPRQLSALERAHQLLGEETVAQIRRQWMAMDTRYGGADWAQSEEIVAQLLRQNLSEGVIRAIIPVGGSRVERLRKRLAAGEDVLVDNAAASAVAPSCRSRPPPKHALSDEDVATIKADAETWPLQEVPADADHPLTLACGHWAPPYRFFTESKLTWAKLHQRYASATQARGARVVSYSRWTQHVHRLWPEIRLTALGKDDVCGDCARHVKSEQDQPIEHDSESKWTRKRQHKETEPENQPNLNGKSMQTAKPNGSQRPPRPLRMPASAYLPLGLEDSYVQRRCVIEYDGTLFNGFQAQEQYTTMRTVQETIENALLRTTGETVRVHGASRTDRGVHARGMVIAFASRCIAEDAAFRAALNNRLPEDVLCRLLERLPEDSDFDPRADSKGKVYAYTIANGGLRPVQDRHHVWFVAKPLDVQQMSAAITLLLAPPLEKDFSAFTPQKSGSNPKGNLCTVSSIQMTVAHGNSDYLVASSSDDVDVARRIRLVFRGNRFLYKMIRNLVGTLVDVGLGKLSPDAIPVILESKSRAKAGQGAPPHGLTLLEVEYSNTS